jgi:hypothetical protein
MLSPVSSVQSVDALLTRINVRRHTVGQFMFTVFYLTVMNF